MKVLSLFDGISYGRVALERAGIPVSRYVAYEIDKNAINCSAWNWPDIEHRGSVVGADFTEFASFDLVMGGFPCQDLSIAGKRAGLEGARSGLFWELVRAIDEVKPRYFFVENNVGMPKDAQWIITETLGVEPIRIDSALVSAQIRKRLYWTNIPGIEQPKDRGVLLEHVIESGAVDRDKSYCLSATYAKAGRASGLRNYICKARRQLVWVIPEATKQGYIEASEGQCVDLAFINSKTRRGRLMLKKSKCLTAQTSPRLYKVTKDWFRLLTPIEFERLQGLPDNYTDMLPKTARYQTVGNGWQVDTIEHCFNYMALDTLL